MEIHQCRINNTNLVLDIPTGKCLEVDNVGYATLKQLSHVDDKEKIINKLSPTYPRSDIYTSLQDIHSLQTQGIFLPDDYNFSPPQSTPITSLTLNVSHACNLRCTYCFAGQGSYGSDAMQMDKRTARRAIDLLINLSGHEKRCEIVFFGGEPLLNVPVIKDAITYSSNMAKSTGKTFTYNMTTNGVLLTDQLIDYLNKKKVKIMISMDGTKDVQDTQRPLPSGKGSYDRILPHVKALSDSRGGQITARMTITQRNLNFSHSVDHLASIGFSRVHCELVSSSCPEVKLDLSKADIEHLEQEYENQATNLLDAIRGHEPYAFGGFRRYLLMIHNTHNRLYTCGAGRRMITVTPSGGVYPCHRFVGMDAFKMGKVYNSTEIADSQKEWTKTTVLSLPKCRTCWARYICAGHCLNKHARDDGQFGEPDPRHCRLAKKEIELSLYLYTKIREEFPEMLAGLSPDKKPSKAVNNADSNSECD